MKAEGCGNLNETEKERKIRMEYEAKMAKDHAQFMRKQIGIEKEHAKQLSKYLRKIEEFEGNSRIHQGSIDATHKSLKTTGIRDYSTKLSGIRASHISQDRQAINKQISVVHNLLNAFEQNFVKAQPCNSNSLSGRIKSTRSHIFDNSIEYVQNR